METRNTLQPPGPRGLPFVGSAFALKRDPLGFLCHLAKEYGDIARFRIGSRVIYQLNHPDYIREVLVTNHQNFRKTGLVLQARPILGNGLLTTEGDFHRRQRRLVQPALMRERIATYTTTITDFAAGLDERWQHGGTVDMFDEMLQVTLKIVAKTLFDVNVQDEATELEHALTTAIEYFNRLLSPRPGLLSRFPSPRNRRYREAQTCLDRFVDRMIAERRGSRRDRGDVLSMLLTAQDEAGDGTGMDDRQVRDEVMTLLAAGHETIATALTWTWHLLAQNPEAQIRLHQELDSVLGGRLPTSADVPHLVYTTAILAESMRLYPPLWALSRRAVDDFPLGGFVIPANATVGVSQYVTHRDPRYYEHPDRFLPSRWTPAEKAKRPKYSYFPFGAGPRVCVGEPFAWHEGVLLLATIARRWEMRPLPGDMPQPQALITLRPRGSLPLVVCRRPAPRETRPQEAELAEAT